MISAGEADKEGGRFFSMWTVVYIARDRAIGESVKASLEKEGLLVMIRPVKLSGGEGCQFELLVPEAEAMEAQEVLNSVLKR